MENVKEIIQKLQDEFESGKIFQYLKPELLISKTSKPSSVWSLCNRLIMYVNDTRDARGFKQWKQVGRNVKKGAKAFGILAPRFIKKQDEKKKEEVFVLAGFLAIPVFRFEDTEGEPLVEDHFEPATYPPLSEIAKLWNIEVKWEGVANPNQGTCAFYQGSANRIVLYTFEPYTFLHELSHAAHHRVKGELKGGQDPEQEFVAEFSAACLAHILGIHEEKKEASSLAYCQGYLGASRNPSAVLLAGLSDAEKVLKLILETKEAVNGKAA